MKLTDLGEFGFFDRIAQRYPTKSSSILKGVGDDAAVLALSEKAVLLLSTDQLIEGYHFRLDMTNAWELGWKALAVNLSDIAAMGGTPTAFTLSLGIPTQTVSVEFLDDFYQGATSLGNKFGVELLGGDTSQGGERLVISVAIVGEAKKNEVVYRNGGKDEDAIYVTGFLGEAALGLKLLEREADRTEFEGLLKRYLCPTPRTQEACVLAERRLPTAMIDISDGLIADLYHLAHQSGLGGEIELPLVPLSPRARDIATRYELDPLELALGGGDDYELLFCVPPAKKELMNQLSEELDCPITRIGKLSSALDDIMVKDRKGTSKRVQPRGYDHFKHTHS